MSYKTILSASYYSLEVVLCTTYREDQNSNQDNNFYLGHIIKSKLPTVLIMNSVLGSRSVYKLRNIVIIPVLHDTVDWEVLPVKIFISKIFRFIHFHHFSALTKLYMMKIHSLVPKSGFGSHELSCQKLRPREVHEKVPYLQRAVGCSHWRGVCQHE